MDRMDPRAVDTVLPAAWCARRVKVSRQLFHSWVKRGLIEPAETAADGRALYSVRRALEVEAQTRTSGRSSRAKPKPGALLAELARLQVERDTRLSGCSYRGSRVA